MRNKSLNSTKIYSGKAKVMPNIAGANTYVTEENNKESTLIRSAALVIDTRGRNFILE